VWCLQSRNGKKSGVCSIYQSGCFCICEWVSELLIVNFDA
jgi:hypothetical protein